MSLPLMEAESLRSLILKAKKEIGEVEGEVNNKLEGLKNLLTGTYNYIFVELSYCISFDVL